MLDADLAKLYGVTTKILNQAVRRNSLRFPLDFMFQLAEQESVSLRSQIVTLEKGRGKHRKYRPLAFTEQGVAMLSSVLKSEQAIQVNIEIMRSFVELKRSVELSSDLSQKLKILEARYDAQFKAVFDAIREIMAPVGPFKRRRIGF